MFEDDDYDPRDWDDSDVEWPEPHSLDGPWCSITEEM